ncbi:hypothetical protein [Paenibacillus hexagrammi]|uniref:DUF4282 domain-containing protein n=1 Tax=Paenibacillus hexagrammi TaxID=2908839 RepID=A0ABY3SQB7_9BACL|nr:hypothetical protein [Paenibacillus sp. YPD9-1]UJF36047.1 hypothetical protein L0M14_13795 [Paenibacillus sp. YPD9-1]
MSYQEKKNVMQLISSFVVFAGYSWILFVRFQALNPVGEELYRFWGAAFLILVPVTMIVRMIIEILFMIINRIATQETAPSFSDELDKIIDLKAMRMTFLRSLLDFL